MALQFTSAKLVKYWTGSAWAESQDFGNIKMWNGSEWQHVGIRPYADIVSETQTVTVGANVIDIEEPFLYLEFYGYASGEFGSISDGTFELISNATINHLYWLSNDTLTFTLAGNRAKSGWSTVLINSITFNRSAATYSYDSGTNTTSWYWEMIGSNPFGTTEGITRAAVFTP